jgi:DNA-binding NtrC family response regulator
MEEKMENQEQTEEVLNLDVTGLPTLEQVEQRYLTLVLQKAGGNKVQAAKMLGVSVKTIYNKLNSYAAPKTEQQ